MIATFTKQYGLLIALVAVAVVFDTATGMIEDKINGKPIDSKTGTKGFWKKVALLVGLFFGFFLDWFIPIMLTYISITLPFDMPFALIICFYIVLNECISICENLYEANPSVLPGWIVKLLGVAKDKLEEGSNDEKRN
jgi:toxin secretion/phage lysis holin